MLVTTVVHDPRLVCLARRSEQALAFAGLGCY